MEYGKKATKRYTYLGKKINAWRKPGQYLNKAFESSHHSQTTEAMGPFEAEMIIESSYLRQQWILSIYQLITTSVSNAAHVPFAQL